jgi:hypothetical protein
MRIQSDENKAQIYNKLMFQFQRTQEQIKDIETGNVLPSRDNGRKLTMLREQLAQIQNQIRSLY